ncbi:MAG: Hsp20 family protein [Pseudomonadales bacterium]|nr:Hsp20 family protein [Pseudomonadales bacterium]
MATSKVPPQEPVSLQIVHKLSKAFEQAQERVRERAYHIFQQRDPEGGDSTSDWLEAQMQVLSPLELELKEQKKNIVVEGSLQGFSPREIEIEVGGAELRVFGAHTDTDNTSAPGSRQTQSRSAYFYQCLPLPCAVEAEKCSARLYKNGKLKITLPRKAEK